MVIWGTKTRALTGGAVQDAGCTNCNNSHYTAFGVLKYFHVYWIPIFITSKTVGIECTNCQQTLVNDEIPDRLIQQIKADVLTPIRTLPMFTGLFIVALACLWLADAHRADVAEETAFLAQPEINDYYIFNLSRVFEESHPDYPFGIFRITAIHPTEVEMQLGNHLYEKGSGFWKDINEARVTLSDYFGPDIYVFSFDELQAYQDSGALYSIDRR